MDVSCARAKLLTPLILVLLSLSALPRHAAAHEPQAREGEKAAVRLVQLLGRQALPTTGCLTFDGKIFYESEVAARRAVADLCADGIQPGFVASQRYKERKAYEVHPGSCREARRWLERSLQGEVAFSKLWELFQDLKQQKHIAHRFPENGCHARAHLMAKRLEELGYLSRKIFVESPQDGLIVDSVWSSMRPLGWYYHVAPLLLVRMPDGTRANYVLDPSLLDEPVPASKWLQRISERSKVTCRVKSSQPRTSDEAKGCYWYITSRFRYEPWSTPGASHSNHRPDPSFWREIDFSHARKDMQMYGPVDLQRRRILEPLIGDHP